VIDEKSGFLLKAREALDGAESEFTNKRYNNAANRAYPGLHRAGYACFHAAIAALLDAGMHPPGRQWGHDYVQAQFSGLLIHRRKLYPEQLGNVLSRNIDVRKEADYDAESVSEKDAKRAIEKARQFVEAVEAKVR
jgi:uncharacterized protein (UPF0332 family)